MIIKIKQLKKLSSDFHQAILRCDLKKLPITFQDFPNGACGDSSILLGKYLQQNGFNEIQYISGWRDEISHAWLLVDGLIVDITANQFPEIKETVVISDNSPWHEQFLIDTDDVIDFQNYDAYTRCQMSAVYEHILTKIK